MQIINIILTLILIVLIPFLVITYYDWKKNKILNMPKKFNKKNASIEAERIAKKKIEDAKETARLIQSSNDRALSDLKNNIEEQKKEVEERDKLVEERNKILESRLETLRQKEAQISELKKSKSFKSDYIDKLSEVGNISLSEVRREIENDYKQEIEKYIANTVSNYENSLVLDAEKLAEFYIEELLPIASVEYSADSTSSHIEVENEAIVSKIKGDKNINIEKLIASTGVEIDTEARSRDGKRLEINVSSLDTIRKEVAIRVIQKALKSKEKITPDWIERTVISEKKYLLQDVKEAGEYACKQVGLDDLPDKLKTIVGKCKYRFSYGQNLLKHNIEMAKIGTYLATVLGADKHIAKVACFLHDIGKVEPDEVIPHHHISAELVKTHYSDSEVLYNAIIAHHFDVDAKHIEAHIVRIADSISGARPGARRNSAEEYFEKVRALDEISSTYSGVNQVQIMNGAREVRVIVKPDEVDDIGSDKLASNIAEEIEDKLNYPGSIKVNVIRSTKATAVSGSSERE